MAVFHLLVTGLLFWFGILPLIRDTVVSAELSTMYIALTVFVALSFLSSFTAFHVVSNTWLRLLAKNQTGRRLRVAMISLIMQTNVDVRSRLSQIDVLYRNFMNECAPKSRGALIWPLVK